MWIGFFIGLFIFGLIRFIIANIDNFYPNDEALLSLALMLCSSGALIGALVEWL